MNAVTIAHAGRRAGERWFFVGMGALAVAIAFVGFIWRYFLPMSAGTFHAPALIHIHGLTMWSWTILFLAQSWLAATGRLRHHRLFGMAGISLLTLAVASGTAVALRQLARRVVTGDADFARAFVALPLSLLVLMVVLFVAAIVNARRTEVHSRLMLLVTLVALEPALARIVGALRGGIIEPMVNGTIAGVVVVLLIGVAMAYDVRSRGRIHPAYVWGGATVVAVHVARAALNHTAAWYAVTDSLLLLVG